MTQEPVSACEATAQDKLRKRQAFTLKKLVDVARRNALAFGDASHAQIKFVEMLGDIGDDGAQPTSGNAATVIREYIAAVALHALTGS